MILVLHLGVVAQQEEMKQMRIRQKANATSRAERTTEFQDSDSVRHLHSKDQISMFNAGCHIAKTLIEHYLVFEFMSVVWVECVIVCLFSRGQRHDDAHLHELVY